MRRSTTTRTRSVTAVTAALIASANPRETDTSAIYIFKLNESDAPISAVMMLSWRIMRRAWRRVIPIARSMPSSRVRSKVESTSVLTMPNRLTITDRARST